MDHQTGTVARRWRLRSATEGEHQRLDKLISDAGIFANRHLYADFLQLQLASYSAYERAARRFAGAPGSWEAATRSEAIRDDLADLGRPHPRVAPDLNAEPPATLAAFAGQAYVMEGAQLGGAVLFRHHSDTLGISAHRGGRFLSWRGAPGSDWPAFCRWLDALDFTECADREAIGAAEALFRAYRARVERLMACAG